MDPRFMWVFLLAACGPHPCINPKYQIPPAVSQDELREEWEHRFGSLPEACDEPLPFTSVSDPSAQCGIQSAGCFIDNGCPYALIGGSYLNDRTLAAHEIAHWYLHCSGRISSGDPNHTMPDVWGSEGFVQFW
jgi:hypothetical protein